MPEVVGATGATRSAPPLRDRVCETLTRLSRTAALPTLSHAATAALQIARDPDADAEKLCGVIRTDVGLAACMMRIANSVVYARRQPATTLETAVLTVGLRKTCDILVAASARHLYGAAGQHAEVLWKHALAVAIAAQDLARVTRRVDPATAFLPGLFHDVGRIAFMLADRTSFDVIQKFADAGEGERRGLEREWYGFDHAEAGGIVAETWGLLPEQCHAIRGHHDATQAGAGAALAAILNGADAVAYGIAAGTGSRLPDGVALAHLGLSADDETACLARVREAFAAQHALLH